MKKQNLWLSCKANLLKKFWPKRAVMKHCLKASPDAALFLPGKDAELKVLGRISSVYKWQEAVRTHEWSPATRHTLYERGNWQLLGVTDLWEFEFLMKNTLPIVYLSESKTSYRYTPAFDVIVKALAISPDYAKFMAEHYPNVAKDLGANVLQQVLPKKYLKAMVEVLVEKHPQLALDYAKYYPADSEMVTQIFSAAWQANADMAPILELIYANRPDLFRLFKDKEQQTPTHNGLKAMFMDILPGLLVEETRTEAGFQEYLSWLKILETYAAAAGADLWFLQAVYARLKIRNEIVLLRELEAIIQKHAPNILILQNMARGKH